MWLVLREAKDPDQDFGLACARAFQVLRARTFEQMEVAMSSAFAESACYLRPEGY